MTTFTILTCFFLVCAAIVRAEPARIMGTEEWQLTFDVIKNKLAQLAHQNELLTGEYRYLGDQEIQLRTLIADKGQSNQAIRRFLEKQGGKTDQQIKIEELMGVVKQRKSSLGNLEQRVAQVRKQTAEFQRSVDLKSAKISRWELFQNPSALTLPVATPGEVVSGDSELDSLRQELEDQKKQEVIIESNLSSMASVRTQDPELGALRQRVELLLRQKAQLLARKSQPASFSSVLPDRSRYLMAIERKDRLSAKIRRFDAKMKVLKNSPSAGLDWSTQRKNMIRDIVQADTRNAQLREQVNNLRQNTTVLKDRIAVLKKSKKK